MNNQTTAPVAIPTGGKLVSTAHHQWASRPADERFSSVFDLAAHFRDRKAQTKEVIKPFADLRAEAVGCDVQLATAQGKATLTHHSFGQLASTAGLSSSGLRASFEAFRSTADAAKWVADGINLGLSGRDGSTNANLLLTKTMTDGVPGLQVRSINTEQYTRVWDMELVQKILLPLEEFGFVNPPAFDGPGGLYAGDRDMFALMVPRNVRRINMSGVTCELCREPFEVNGHYFSPFIMLQNSEVGGSSIRFSSGLVEAVCANLNLWGVTGMAEVSIAHKGDPLKRLMKTFEGFLNTWVKTPPTEEENIIRLAMGKTIAKDVAGVQEILGQKTNLSSKAVMEAVNLVERGNMSTGIVSQDPTNLWNLVAAITANARHLVNQNEQMDMVRQGGKLMSLALR